MFFYYFFIGKIIKLISHGSDLELLTDLIYNLYDILGKGTLTPRVSGFFKLKYYTINKLSLNNCGNMIVNFSKNKKKLMD